MNDNCDQTGFLIENRELIFERFCRGKAAASDGAGLGLAIVKEIMNAHKGGIDVEENPGGGTIITLRFAGHARQEWSP